MVYAAACEEEGEEGEGRWGGAAAVRRWKAVRERRWGGRESSDLACGDGILLLPQLATGINKQHQYISLNYIIYILSPPVPLRSSPPISCPPVFSALAWTAIQVTSITSTRPVIIDRHQLQGTNCHTQLLISLNPLHSAMHSLHHLPLPHR